MHPANLERKIPTNLITNYLRTLLLLFLNRAFQSILHLHAARKNGRKQVPIRNTLCTCTATMLHLHFKKDSEPSQKFCAPPEEKKTHPYTF